MMPGMRGQISVELLLSFSIVLLLLTIFSLDSLSKNAQVRTLTEDLSAIRECQRIAAVAAIQSRFSHWSQTDINVGYKTSFRENQVHINDTFCTFIGIPLNADTAPGTLRFIRTRTGLVVQNA